MQTQMVKEMIQHLNNNFYTQGIKCRMYANMMQAVMS